MIEIEDLELTGGDAADLLKAGAALGAPRIATQRDALPYALVPDGYTVEALPTATRPKRNAFTARLGDAASFITYLKAYGACDDSVTIYATLKPAVFLAVLDDVEVPTGRTAWREWRAEYALAFSREWTVWTAKDRAKLTQTDFAEFLQDNLPDVVTPPGAQLLELALNFEASIDGTFVSAQRLADGNVNFAYRHDTVQRDVRMPTVITLSIPVFEGDMPREVQARLKWRIAEGRLTITYELVRPHKVIEAAFMDTWARIANDTGVAILRGRPE